MTSMGFEPTIAGGELPQTYALDRATPWVYPTQYSDIS